ncbi:hypothetical protein A3D03_04180 [Candidatus Gottesmanbacteria bacterium RIFCSPHIGHO2_02_FULL_40_13]|uniref:Four helix bundle protein n=1 Tax=Candidatus Gottesmanbacteria bacterium RIFCSPHIGHO2_02_FULL_40_13 TaxID=1798384 RepID=A0A1F6A899_9BACT|nr:MAG: hypothetical protein A3D03_04180 [Candidatus Gottesmanbacteria bacterium RIFCSPHIGHO2_02_FULL_40_13]
MTVKSYKELIVWQKAMLLVKEIYLLTEKFPQDELYGLTSQIRRAGISIPSNIAEGYLRKHRKEFVQFLSISLSSAAELETQILICKSINKFKHMNFSQIDSLLLEVMKMLYVMIEKINS